MSGSNDIFVTETLTNAVFDGPQLFNSNASVPVTLSGTYVTEYTPDGTLVGVENVSLVASTSESGFNASTLNSAYITRNATPGASGTDGLNEINVNNNGGGGSFNNAYLDFAGETPTALDSGQNSSIGNPSGLEYLNGGAASNDGVITSSVGFDVDKYVSTTFSNTIFDGNGEPVTLNGTMLTEYNAGGTLIGVSNVSLVASDPSDTSSYPSNLTAAVISVVGTPGAAGGPGINEIKVTASGGSFQQAYLDFFGQTPSQLQSNGAADGGHYSSIGYPSGLEALAGGTASNFGSGTDTVLDTFILTTIANVVFDSAGQPETINGVFEAEYNPGGTLVGISNVDLTETGAVDGTFNHVDVITAGNPTAGGADALNELTFYGPASLYLDYYGEQPTSVFSGSYGGTYSSVNIASGLYEQIGSSGSAGTITTEQVPPCFAAGTRILTPAGEIAVEHLREGDQVILADGATAPIKWLGRRTLNLTRHPRPDSVRPIRIAAGALASGLPARTLLVSPDHALFLDNLLVPAKTLLNGESIVQLAPPAITYFHIELPAHAILLAEGVPAESYLETGNRGAFENGGEPLTLHPDFAQTLRAEQSCAPLAESGPAIEAIRARLLARAHLRLTHDAALQISFADGAATITSRAAIPADLTPDPRDRRRLGVKIASLAIAGQPIPLDHPDLTQGWHAPEPNGRWTNGAALIPATLLGGQTEIDITLAETNLPYRVAG